MPDKRPGMGLEGPPFVQGLVHDFRSEQHVPEPFRSMEIQDQEETAKNNQGKGDQVAGARQRPIQLAPEEINERGDEIGPGGNASQEKIQDNPPAPLGIGNEEVHGWASLLMEV